MNIDRYRPLLGSVESFHLTDTFLSFEYADQVMGVCSIDLTSVQWNAWNRCCDILRVSGFAIQEDQTVAESIRKGYRRGIHPSGLEVRTEAHRKLVRFEFYQNVNSENPAGGEYDFHKRARMPYLIGLRFESVVAKLTGFFVSIGARPSPSKVASPVEDPLAWYIQTWGRHFGGTEKRDANGWPTLETRSHWPKRKLEDRDGVAMVTGGLYWRRMDNGRLALGRAYPSANEMWFHVYGNSLTDYASAVSSAEFFTQRGSESLRRRVPLERALIRMEKAKAKAVKEESFERAALLRDAIRRMKRKVVP